MYRASPNARFIGYYNEKQIRLKVAWNINSEPLFAFLKTVLTVDFYNTLTTVSKVPHPLKNVKFCVIMIMTDEESVVLVTQISNSYILLVKQNEKESSVKITESSDNKPHTIVLSTKKYEPFREYLSSCFAEIKEIYDLSSLPTYYECRFKHYKSPNVKMFVYCVRGDCYADITVSGKNKDRIIQQMELIHTTLEKSKASEQFTLITSYDSVSEYYCNKMYPLLNEVERKLRKLLYIIYTLRYRKDYIEYTFVENTLSPESKKNIEAYLKKEIGTGNREIWRQKYFEQFEYKHYKHLLFYPKWTVIDIANKDEFLKSNPDLAKLGDEELRERFSTFTPMSDWEKHFSNKVDKDISAETLISNVQKPRNKVAHYKTITKDEYEAFLENVHKLIEVIDKAIDISVSKDFIQEGMKYLTDNMSKALESLRNTISEYVLNTFPYFFQSAKSAVGALTELFDEAEESVEDSESEDEDNA